MNDNSTLDLLLCPTCHKGKIENQGNQINCTKCQAVFPLLEKNIPILLKNKDVWLQDSYNALLEQLEEMTEKTSELKAAIASSEHSRASTLSKWLEGICYNHAIYSSFLKPIRELAGLNELKENSRNKKKDLLDYHDSENIFNYLRRDWSGSTTTETEIKVIEERVFSLIKKHCSRSKTAVVLGAGMGRFAQDISCFFEKTVAVELSFMMGILYQRLKEKDITFYDQKTRNSVTTEGQFRKHTASMKPLNNSDNSKHQLDYIIADSLNLPLPSHSVSTIISIYFTDVLPIEKLWKEVKRVLKPGGVFIHFGPLSYHFGSLASHYSADDFRSYLKSQKSKIVDEIWDKNSYLKYSETLYSSLYKNWSFAALQPEK